MKYNKNTIVIDAAATIGEKSVLLGIEPLFEYVNNQKTLNIIGSKLTILSLKNYERYTVKLPQKVEELDVQERDEVSFVDLEATPYVYNNRVALSLKAGDVVANK